MVMIFGEVMHDKKEQIEGIAEIVPSQIEGIAGIVVIGIISSMMMMNVIVIGIVWLIGRERYLLPPLLGRILLWRPLYSYPIHARNLLRRIYWGTIMGM